MASRNQRNSNKYHKFNLHPYGIALLLFALLFGVIGGYVVLFSKAAMPLTWSPPSSYTSYPVKTVTPNVNTQTVSGGGGDMLVKLPSTPTGPITFTSCRNVVVIGGQINLPPNSGPGTDMRGLYINGCTGTVHIEGVYINGDIATAEGDGIAINAPEAIVQIENVRVNKLYGGQDTAIHNHSDIIQPWGGVKELRVDHLSGTTNFQGFQINDDQGHIGKVIIKNANIGDSGVTPPTSNGGYYLWVKCGTGTTYSFENFFVQPRSGRTLGNSLWDGGCGLNAGSSSATYTDGAVSGVVAKGQPAIGDYVPSGSVGIGYKTTGYAVTGATTPTPTTSTTPTVPTTPSTPPPSGGPADPNTNPTVPTTPTMPTQTTSGTIALAVPTTSAPTTKTEVYVDGKMVASTSDDTTPALNTAQLGNGEHTVLVKKIDVNGIVAESAQTIDVKNSLFTQVLGQVTTKTGKLITAGLVLIISIAVILVYKKMRLPFLPKS